MRRITLTLLALLIPLVASADYQTVQFLYSRAVEYAVDEGMMEDILGYDYFVVTGGGQAEISALLDSVTQAKMEPRIFRYVDWWGSSYPEMAESHVPRWFPGPGDLGYPIVRTDNSPYLYRIDSFHPRRFLEWCLPVFEMFPDQAGIFLDDFNGNKDYWRLTQQQRRQMWPGWRPGDWAQPLLYETEWMVRSFAGIRGQSIVVNGRGRRFSGPRLWESVGKWISIGELKEGAKPGDFVLVKGIAGDRISWVEVIRPEGGYPLGTSFKVVFRDVLRIADELGLVVGLCMEEKPPSGGSTCGVHKWSNPDTWGKIQ